MACVAGSNGSENYACLRCNLIISFWFRHRGRSTDSWMNNTAPSLSNDLFTTGSPSDRFRGFVSSARNFSKCSEQTWQWLSLSKFTPLIRTSYPLRAVCCKDQLRSCNIEKNDFSKLCQNKGLGELVLKI